MSLEHRIVDLESRAAFQDKLLAELDEVVRDFSERVERLEFEVKALRESLNVAPIGPPDEPPPHY